MSQEAVDYNKWLLPKLKEELKKRGLPQTGNKAELVARLSEADVQNTSTAEEAVEDVAAEGEEQMEGDGENEEEEKEVEEDVEEGGEGKEEHAENANGDEAGEGDEQQADGEEAHEEGKEEKTEEKAEDKGPSDEEIYKEIESQFSIEFPLAERDSISLMWNGKKLRIPCSNDIYRELASACSLKSFVVHPLKVTDMRSTKFQQLADKSLKFSFEFFDRSSDDGPTGFAKFVFDTVEASTAAQEELKAYNEAFKFDTLKFEFKEGEDDIVQGPYKAPPSENSRPIVQRLLYVGNLPNDVTEPTLQQLFPDAIRVIFPRRGNEENAEKSEPTRFAFLEFTSSDEATKAAEASKELTLNDEKLFVIRAFAVRRDKTGVMSDFNRSILIDKTRKLKRIVKTPYNKTERDLKEIGDRITENLEQLTKDTEVRESWGMKLGRLDASKVDEDDPRAAGQGGRGGFRGRGGPRGGGAMGGGRGMSWGSPRGNYGGQSYGTSPGGYRRGGGGGGGGYYTQPYGGGYPQQFMGGYQSYGSGGSYGGGQNFGMKRRADDNGRGGGSWKRARGTRGGGSQGYY